MPDQQIILERFALEMAEKQRELDEAKRQAREFQEQAKKAGDTVEHLKNDSEKQYGDIAILKAHLAVLQKYKDDNYAAREEAGGWEEVAAQLAKDAQILRAQIEEYEKQEVLYLDAIRFYDEHYQKLLNDEKKREPNKK